MSGNCLQSQESHGAKLGHKRGRNNSPGFASKRVATPCKNSRRMALRIPQYFGRREPGKHTGHGLQREGSSSRPFFSFEVLQDQLTFQLRSGVYIGVRCRWTCFQWPTASHRFEVLQGFIFHPIVLKSLLDDSHGSVLLDDL